MRVRVRVRVGVRGVGTERGVSGRRGVCSRVASGRGISHIGSNQLEHSGQQSGVAIRGSGGAPQAFRWRRERLAAADWGVDGMLVEVSVWWSRFQT